jgi:hypothetical protein
MASHNCYTEVILSLQIKDVSRETEMREYVDVACRFLQLLWSDYEPLNPHLCNHPTTWFLPDTIIKLILNKFLAIRSHDELLALLITYSW